VASDLVTEADKLLARSDFITQVSSPGFQYSRSLNNPRGWMTKVQRLVIPGDKNSTHVTGVNLH